MYSGAALAEVSPERVARHFVRKGDGYQVSQELRQMVVFAPHNIIKDAPFTKLDLISCRNLVIYFQPPAQKKAMSLFHFGLKTGGILFLGPSESPGELTDEFDHLDNHWKIYRKRRDVRLSADLRLPLSIADAGLRPTGIPPLPHLSQVDMHLVGVYDAILEEHMPPSLLVDENRALVQSFGGASRYLRLRDGRLSTDLLEMVDTDLRMALAGALQRAFKDAAPIVYKGLRVHLADGQRLVNLTVKPIRNRRSSRFYALVSIEELNQAVPPDATEINFRQASDEQLQGLETELRYTKENLQATIEELETSNEELQATNEELVASNEELQSTNEELHSVNEELYTVNAEYQKKIAELTELNADMDSLLASTEVHTVFLDRDLTIRKFTPKIAEVFNLLPQDVGRRIDNFTHHIQYEPLMETIHRVLDNAEPFEREVQDRHGRWFLLRILPYRNKTRIDGIVLTLIDVSPLKLAEEEAREAVRRRDHFLAMLSHELRNPLGAVLNSVHLMERPGIDDVARQEAQAIIVRQAQQMARLLDDLLDVSRITQNKIEIHRDLVDLRAAAAEAVQAARPMIESRRQELKVEIESSPLFVMGDAARLQQIQVNLLHNAAKYTPPEGTIWLSVCRQDGDAVIRVRDTGAGIPPDMLETIFDLFVQNDRTLDRADGGMGVGLTLVRTLVAMHGGTVTARSDGIGRGSEFVVRIPLTIEQRPAVTPEQPSKLPAGNARTDRGRQRG